MSIQKDSIALQTGREFVAIEAKATARLRSEHFVGLKAISGLSGLRRKILVYLGKEKRRHEDIEVLPFSDFIGEFGAGMPKKREALESVQDFSSCE